MTMHWSVSKGKLFQSVFARTAKFVRQGDLPMRKVLQDTQLVRHCFLDRKLCNYPKTPVVLM